MRMISDPSPKLDPRDPTVMAAVNLIKLELAAVRRECPQMTERQALQEARRRCHKAMLSVVDAIAEKRRRRGLQDGQSR
jgi:hypothetical protein